MASLEPLGQGERSKHTLAEQPNDHLNLIMGLLEARDLHRLLSVSQRLALFATKYLPAAHERCNRALAAAMAELAKESTTYSNQLMEALKEHVIPGVTVAEIGTSLDFMTLERTGLQSSPITTSHVDLIRIRCGRWLKTLHLGAAAYGSSKVYDRDIEALALDCPHLESIDLSHCDVGDRALQALSEGCRKLKVLKVAGISYMPNDTFTDPAIEALALGCRELTTLELIGCNLLTDRSIEAVAKPCPQLTRLRVRDCTKLTDRAMLALVDQRRQLIELEVHNCRLLTDASIQVLVLSCPHLTALDVSYTKITTLTIQAIGTSCRDLTQLGVDYCNELLTDTDIDALVKCRQLEVLHASFTKLSNHSLDRLVRETRLSMVWAYSSGLTDKGRKLFVKTHPGVLKI